MTHLLFLYELVFDDFQPSRSDTSDVIYINTLIQMNRVVHLALNSHINALWRSGLAKCLQHCTTSLTHLDLGH